jgi:hypothetical protein
MIRKALKLTNIAKVQKDSLNFFEENKFNNEFKATFTEMIALCLTKYFKFFFIITIKQIKLKLKHREYCVLMPYKLIVVLNRQNFGEICVELM